MRLALNVAYECCLADALTTSSIPVCRCLNENLHHAAITTTTTATTRIKTTAAAMATDKIITLKVVFLGCKGDLLVIFIHRIAYTRNSRNFTETKTTKYGRHTLAHSQ